MRIDVVASPQAAHQVAAARALIAGLDRHGVEWRAVETGSGVTADIVACWGWRNGRQHKALGRRVLVMERGYVADRFRWTSLGWDGLNGRARFPAVDDGGARWRRLFGHLMDPERSGGDRILVMGQVQGDAAVAGIDLPRWYVSVGAQLSARYGLQACFRPHPVSVGRRLMPRRGSVYGMEIAEGSLGHVLARARAAVAWNSNALTDAALAGVDILAGDEGAMAWPIAGQWPSLAPRLDAREAWAHGLAWCQWEMEEIASGEAWQAVRTAMDPVSAETVS